MNKWIFILSVLLLSQFGRAEELTLNDLVGKCSFAFNSQLKDQILPNEVFLNIYFKDQKYFVTQGHAAFAEPLSQRNSKLDQHLEKIQGTFADGLIHWGEGDWVALYLLIPNRLDRVLLASGRSHLAADPYPSCYFFE